MSNAGSWRRRLVALVLAAICLSGCATDGYDPGRLGACPPVVEYSRELQALAAEELALLPEGSATMEMLAEYAVMWEQDEGPRKWLGRNRFRAASVSKRHDVIVPSAIDPGERGRLGGAD